VCACVRVCVCVCVCVWLLPLLVYFEKWLEWIIIEITIKWCGREPPDRERECVLLIGDIGQEAEPSLHQISAHELVICTRTRPRGRASLHQFNIFFISEKALPLGRVRVQITSSCADNLSEVSRQHPQHWATRPRCNSSCNMLTHMYPPPHTSSCNMLTHRNSCNIMTNHGKRPFSRTQRTRMTRPRSLGQRRKLWCQGSTATFSRTAS
jgi:hypothetical protein